MYIRERRHLKLRLLTDMSEANFLLFTFSICYYVSFLLF